MSYIPTPTNSENNTNKNKKQDRESTVNGQPWNIFDENLKLNYELPQSAYSIPLLTMVKSQLQSQIVLDNILPQQSTQRVSNQQEKLPQSAIDLPNIPIPQIKQLTKIQNIISFFEYIGYWFLQLKLYLCTLWIQIALAYWVVQVKSNPEEKTTSLHLIAISCMVQLYQLMEDYTEIEDIFIWYFNQPERNKNHQQMIYQDKDEKLIIKGFTKKEKRSLRVFCFINTCITVLTMFAGFGLILQSENNMELILNALAIQFIHQIDNIMYIWLEQNDRQFIENAKKIQDQRGRHTNSGRGFMFFGIIAIGYGFALLNTLETLKD